MRNFYDPWANILDEKGKLLVGRITFFEANTTDKKNIYGTDGVTVLPNPIYTDGFGKTMNQVLLEDSDYTIRFERYIGNGNMETDPSESAWMNYKTVLSKNGDFTNIISGSNIVSVKSVDELKAISNMQDGDVVQLIGYFNAGDSGEPRLYIWHSTGNVNDDGGVTIKSISTNTGYWRMVIPGTYIDVRWYGDLPDTAANPENPKSNLGQRAKAAQAANIYRKDLYFPCSTSNTYGFYIFDGSNTVSVNKDIICDNGVRFVVRTGTTGTSIQCHELQKCDRYLFVAPSSDVQIGHYALTADWIKASWLRGWVEASGAREGYILDEMNLPLQFSNTKIKIENSPMSGTVMNNCQVLEGHKVITNAITMQNMTIKTEWFADDYSWSNLTISGCKILLENCKDANTYILLKNKQLESDYGDLGEQSINAQVRAGGTIENCYGTVTFISHGNTEFHNATLTVNGVNQNDTLNAVDTWLTFGSDTVLSGISLRRGSISGTANGLQLLNDSLLDNVDINCPIVSLGTKLTIRNSNIYAHLRGTDTVLINNQIYSEVEQTDDNGIVNVLCTGNMFHIGNGIAARHFINAATDNSMVKGIWSNNGSSYDTIHWIRINRTHLKPNDHDHQYSYMNNAEPYLQKYNGINHVMSFPVYGGSRFEGRDIFATYDKPFMFVNKLTLDVTIVNRHIKWKTFSVGRGFLARRGHIQCQFFDGIFEDHYTEHNTGDITIVWTWGGTTTTSQAIMNGNRFGYCHMSSLDGAGEANYDVSFEPTLQNHTSSVFSNGAPVGYLTRAPYDDWDGFPLYPAQNMRVANIMVFMDNNFVAGSSTPES